MSVYKQFAVASNDLSVSFELQLLQQQQKRGRNEKWQSSVVVYWMFWIKITDIYHKVEYPSENS